MQYGASKMASLKKDKYGYQTLDSCDYIKEYNKNDPKEAAGYYVMQNISLSTKISQLEDTVSSLEKELDEKRSALWNATDRAEIAENELATTKAELDRVRTGSDENVKAFLSSDPKSQRALKSLNVLIERIRKLENENAALVAENAQYLSDKSKARDKKEIELKHSRSRIDAFTKGLILFLNELNKDGCYVSFVKQETLPPLSEPLKSAKKRGPKATKERR